MIKTFSKNLRKYTKLYGAFLRMGFITDFEYRTNFTLRVVTDIFWYAAQIFVFETLFMHTETIGSWNLAQMRVFLGVLFVVDGFYMVILHDNMERMTEKIRNGELDLLLAKPVSSQFMVSFQKVGTSLLANLAIGSCWFAYALSNLPDLNPIKLLWLFILVPCALIAIYSVKFCICALGVIFTRSDYLIYIWYQFYKLGMKPDRIYPPWVRFLIMTIMPVGFIASVPSRTIMESTELALIAWTVVCAGLLLWGSSKFWNYALKHYSSASS